MLLPPYQLHEQVRLIRIFAGLNQSDMSSRLGMTQGWLSKLESGIGEVTVNQLYILRDQFGISADAIMDGNIPFLEIANRFGASLRLPRKYLRDNLSRARVIYGFIALLEESHGAEAVLAKLKEMHVPKAILAEPRYPISTKLLFDVISICLEDKLLDSQDAWKTVAEQVLSPVSLGTDYATLASTKNPVDTYRRFFALTHHFSSSCEYQVEEISEESLRVQVTKRTIPSGRDNIFALSTGSGASVVQSYESAVLRQIGREFSRLDVDVKTENNGSSYLVNWA